MNPFRAFYNKVEQLYDKKIDSSGLAIFRIAWGIILFFEVREMYIFRKLRFDTIPYIESFDLSFGSILIVWMVLTIFLIFGFKTKWVTIVNYLLSVLFFGSIHEFEYHAFYAYLGINFLLILLPISNSFSLDSLLERIKFTRVNYIHKPKQKVSVLYYFLPILVGIAFVYSDSILFKLGSPTWTSGLGVWRPSVLPNFNVSSDFFFLNNEFITKLMGYTTLVFEFVFIFIFFIKKLRWLVFIIGMGLHLGILLVFPIPLFALAVCCIYLLIIPVKTWRWILSLFKSKEPKITFIYDTDCPLCTKTRVVIESLDVFNRIGFQSAQTAKSCFEELKDVSESDLITHIYSVSKKGKVYSSVNTYIQILFSTIVFAPLALIISLPGIKQFGSFVYNYIANNREREICDENHCVVYMPPETVDENKSVIKGISLKKLKVVKLSGLIIVLSLIQLNVSISSGIMNDGMKSIRFWNSSLGNKLYRPHQTCIDFSEQFLGITHHPVFMDGHYVGFKNVFAVTYINKENEEIWLPIIDKNGRPDRYNYGGNWVNWTFRVNRVDYSQESLSKGLIRYTSYWAGRNDIDLNDITLNIRLKKVGTTNKFEKNFLTKENENNWIDFGTIVWKAKKPTIIYYYELLDDGSNDFEKK